VEDHHSGEVTALSSESGFFISSMESMRGRYGLLRENPKDIILNHHDKNLKTQYFCLTVSKSVRLAEKMYWV
jgi:hypothetical protein